MRIRRRIEGHIHYHSDRAPSQSRFQTPNSADNTRICLQRQRHRFQMLRQISAGCENVCPPTEIRVDKDLHESIVDRIRRRIHAQNAAAVPLQALGQRFHGAVQRGGDQHMLLHKINVIANGRLEERVQIIDDDKGWHRAAVHVQL